jgi:hypothetical protein
VEEVGVGGVVREFFEWTFVWGDVDPHGGGLGACEPDGCTVVIEVRATALFEGLGGGVEEAHACEVVVCLAVGQYVKQTEEVAADSPGGRHDGGKEEEVALVVVVLVVVKLRFDSGIERAVGVGV